MAQIKVERKSSNIWIWWLLGLLLVALILWAVFEVLDDNAELAVAPVATQTMPPPPPPADPGTLPTAGTAAGIPVGQIVASPQSWSGRSVTGEVRVTEVVSDRGFWTEADGQRIFVLLNEVPREIKKINAGQRIRMTNATIHAAGDPSGLPGNLDPQAQQIAGGQPVVLAVDSHNVEILGTPAGAP